MGLWNLLTNLTNADGVREAMNMAIDNGLRQSNGDVHSALFNAFAGRCKLRGVPVNASTEPMFWAELLPFLHLKQSLARHAVAEYVVYKERPRDAKIDWLTKAVKYGIEVAMTRMPDEEFNALFLYSKSSGFVWHLLLENRGQEHSWG